MEQILQDYLFQLFFRWFLNLKKTTLFWKSTGIIIHQSKDKIDFHTV